MNLIEIKCNQMLVFTAAFLFKVSDSWLSVQPFQQKCPAFLTKVSGLSSYSVQPPFWLKCLAFLAKLSSLLSSKSVWPPFRLTCLAIGWNFEAGILGPQFWGRNSGLGNPALEFWSWNSETGIPRPGIPGPEVRGQKLQGRN